MNKYQEALNNVKRILEDDSLIGVIDTGLLFNTCEFSVDTLQELVDKETPMKPYYPPQYPTADCPVCKTNIGDNPRCRECGQVIDWTDEDV